MAESVSHDLNNTWLCLPDVSLDLFTQERALTFDVSPVLLLASLVPKVWSSSIVGSNQRWPNNDQKGSAPSGSMLPDVGAQPESESRVAEDHAFIKSLMEISVVLFPL